MRRKQDQEVEFYFAIKFKFDCLSLLIEANVPSFLMSECFYGQYHQFEGLF